MHVLVIGASGLVGSNAVNDCRERGLTVTGTYRTTETGHADVRLDKTDAGSTAALLGDLEPDVVVDAAAFHDVDACETERATAWDVNATGTRNVARATADVGAHLVYLSTDYVFAGDPDEAPYAEDDPIAPQNYYGQTKYAGEQAAKTADEWTILRSSVVYGLASPNFLTWARGELAAGNRIRIVDDQRSSPTYAPDLSRACVTVGRQGLTGIYHAAGPTALNRYEFTRQFADAFGYDVDLIDPIETEELGQEALRPSDSSLDSNNLVAELGVEFRAPEDAFDEMNEAV